MCVSGANIDRVIFLSNRFILLSTKSLLGRCRFWNVLWFTRGASSLLSIDFESRLGLGRDSEKSSSSSKQSACAVQSADCREVLPQTGICVSLVFVRTGVGPLGLGRA